MCIDLSWFIFPKKFLYFLQKRTVRTQCAANYRAPNKPLFQKFGIFEIYSLLSFQVGSFIYLYHQEMLPLSFQNFISNWKYKSIIILLDMPSHTILMSAEQTWKEDGKYFINWALELQRLCDFSQLLAFYIFKGKTGGVSVWEKWIRDERIPKDVCGEANSFVHFLILRELSNTHELSRVV